MNKRDSFSHQILYRSSGLFLSVLLLILIPLAGCGRASVSGEDEGFAAFTQECFKEYVSRDSISLHFKLSDPEKLGISEDISSYGDISLKAQQESCDRASELLDMLHSYHRDALSPDHQLTYDIFKRKLNESAASRDYLLYQTLLGSNGLPSQLPVSFSEYYFRDEKDVKTYLALLRQVPDIFEQLVDFERDRAKAGFQTPDFIIKDTTEQINHFLKGSEEDNLLIETFEERIRSVNTLSEDQKKTYINNNRALFKQIVIPSYESLRDTINSWSNTGSADKERICQYDHGKEYYQLLLQSNVGTDKTPEECIQALQALLKETIADISALNTSHPDLYTEYLSATPALTDPDTILSSLKSDTLMDFPEIEEIPYTLKALPASLSGTSASAFYLVPPIDSRDSNIIYVNQNRVEDKELFSTLAHEGYPGHLYQTNYFLIKEPDPIRHLLRTNGYDEGWGTYAQLYSYHYMDFTNAEPDSIDALRQLYKDNDLLALTLSSLSDLYVNYKNYDKEKLSAYLSAYGIGEENVTTIYQYVVENPTTYLTYCMGYYELTDLKNHYEKLEGKDFSIKEFHQKILDCGSCPFDLLRKNIGIETQIRRQSK